MRQSLREQQIFNAVSEFLESGEKRTIDEIGVYLQNKGLIVIDIVAMVHEQARKALGMHRARCVKARDVQMEIVNLTEEIDNGDGTTTTVPYYRRFDAMDRDEATRLITREYHELTRKNNKFHRYAKALRKKFGARWEKQLPFEFPEKMVYHEPAEAVQ